ncbi:hypothetical protein ACJZ2D_014880 [Fusarium nematophilum]
MADPVTATMAVFSTVCAIISAIKTIQELRAGQHEKRIDSERPTRPPITNSAFELSQLLNRLSSRFGRQFGDRLDGEVKHRLSSLRPQLATLVSELEALQADAARIEADGKDAKGVERRRKTLLENAIRLQGDIEDALIQFSNRIGTTARIDTCNATLKPSDPPRDFCYGAILCQCGIADAESLSTRAMPSKSKPRWGFICMYCYLEVGSYRAIRLSRQGEALVSSSLLAASHLAACSSFNDRRAFYKCLACHQNLGDMEFSSAEALEMHMRKHPTFGCIESEKEAGQATADNNSEFVGARIVNHDGDTKKTKAGAKRPVGGPLCRSYVPWQAGEVAGGLPNDTEKEEQGDKAAVSPITSPPLSARELAEIEVAELGNETLRDVAAHGEGVGQMHSNHSSPEFKLIVETCIETNSHSRHGVHELADHNISPPIPKSDGRIELDGNLIGRPAELPVAAPEISHISSGNQYVAPPSIVQPGMRQGCDRGTISPAGSVYTAPHLAHSVDTLSSVSPDSRMTSPAPGGVYPRPLSRRKPVGEQ